VDDLTPSGEVRRTQRSKGRGFVALGDVDGVERAFGVDAGGAILFACSVAPRYHDLAIAYRSVNRWGSGQFASRQT
jgi:hypothetical protein